VEDFMHRLWQKGALQGNTPAKAFFVKCDRQTTTQEDIANGVFTILVGFAPLKPGEFLLLTIRQRAARNSASAPQ
jgi:phage tail sheath protein FI